MNLVHFDKSDENTITSNFSSYFYPHNPNKKDVFSSSAEIILNLHQFGCISNLLNQEGLLYPFDIEKFSISSSSINKLSLENLDESIRGFSWYYENYTRAIATYIYRGDYSNYSLHQLHELFFDKNLVDSFPHESKGITSAIFSWCEEKRNEYNHGRYVRNEPFANKIQDISNLIMGFLRISQITYNTILSKFFQMQPYSPSDHIENIDIHNLSHSQSILYCNSSIFQQETSKIRNTLSRLGIINGYSSFYFNDPYQYASFRKKLSRLYPSPDKISQSIVKNLSGSSLQNCHELRLLTIRDKASHKCIIRGKKKLPLKLSIEPHIQQVITGFHVHKFLMENNFSKVYESHYAQEIIECFSDFPKLNNRGLQCLSAYINQNPISEEQEIDYCLKNPDLIYFRPSLKLSQNKIHSLLSDYIFDYNNRTSLESFFINYSHSIGNDVEFINDIFYSAAIIIHEDIPVKYFQHFADLIFAFENEGYILYFFNKLYSHLCLYNSQIEASFLSFQFEDRSTVINPFENRVLYLSHLLNDNKLPLANLIFKFRHKIESNFRFNTEKYLFSKFLESVIYTNSNVFFAYGKFDSSHQVYPSDQEMLNNLSSNTPNHAHHINKLLHTQNRGHSDFFSIFFLGTCKDKSLKNTLRNFTYYSELFSNTLEKNYISLKEIPDGHLQQMTFIKFGDKFDLQCFSANNSKYFHSVFSNSSISLGLFTSHMKNLNTKNANIIEAKSINIWLTNEFKPSYKIEECPKETLDSLLKTFELTLSKLNDPNEIHSKGSPSIPFEVTRKMFICSYCDSKISHLHNLFNPQQHFKLNDTSFIQGNIYISNELSYQSIGSLNQQNLIHDYLYEKGRIDHLVCVQKNSDGTCFAAKKNETVSRIKDFFILDAHDILNPGWEFIGLRSKNVRRTDQKTFIPIGTTNKLVRIAQYNSIDSTDSSYAYLNLSDSNGVSFLGRIRKDRWTRFSYEIRNENIQIYCFDNELNNGIVDVRIVKSN